MENGKINYENFVELNDKYIIYILGFLWGDGYISKLKNKHKNYTVGLEISSKDFNDISSIFLKIGKWNIYHRKKYLKKTDKYYEMSCITICNKKLLYLLMEYGYDKKSYISPDILLSKIPEKLHHHFFRGYFDADGSFSIYGKNNKVVKFNVILTVLVY